MTAAGGSRSRIGERLYRLLLRAYPRGFRHSHADEATAVFGRLHASAARRGPRAVATLWARCAPQVFRGAIRERQAARRRARNAFTAPNRDAGPESGGRLPGRHNTLMGSMFEDIRFALLSVRRRPGFASSVILTLGIAIGANAAVFSVVDGVLLRPLPYPRQDRIYRLLRTSEGETSPALSYLNFVDLRRTTETLVHVAAYSSRSQTLTQVGDPVRVDVGLVTPGFFSVLGIEPLRGRAFRADEETPGNDNVVLLSHGFWRRRLGGRVDVVGGPIVLDDEPQTVIGILSPRFDGMPGWEDHEVWRPFTPGSFEGPRANRSVYGVARLADGATLEEAQAELEVIATQLAEQYPGDEVGGLALSGLRQQLSGSARPSLLTFSGAVAFVLLVAIANVANLYLSRGTDRRRELALRAALGARRTRLVRQLVTESGVLAAAGGLLGAAIAMVGVPVLLSASAGSIPLASEVTIDTRVLGYLAAMTLAAALLSGIVPALQLTGAGLQEDMKRGNVRASLAARRRARLRGGLVSAEVGLSLVLLAGAGLLLRSFWTLTAVDTGIDVDNAVTFRLSPKPGPYPSSEELRVYFEGVLGRLRDLPGVRYAEMTHVLPLSGSGTCGTLHRADEPPPEDDRCAEVRAVSGDFFRAMSIPLVQGRSFRATDNPADPIIVVNQTMAAMLWPGEDPIGQMVYSGFAYPLRVVGVVEDVVHNSLEQEPPPQGYRPWSHWPRREMYVVVRTEHDPLDSMGAIRAVVWAIDDSIPIVAVRTLADYVSDSVAEPRLRAQLVSAFALVALLLALVGVYGVVSYAVLRRRGEIAVRLALGAEPKSIFALVLGQGMAPVLVGLVAGAAGAVALTRFLSGFLFRTEPTDPLAHGSVAALVLLVSLIAISIPARRAMRVAPIDSLRNS